MSVTITLRPVTRPSRYEQELAALNDAGRLAELWQAALRASFQLGYDSGSSVGCALVVMRSPPPGRRS